jgi:hypothetical protein
VRDHPVRFERARSALWRRSGTEILAALPEDRDARRLSGSASAVWTLIDAPRSVPELVHELAAAYRIPPEEIEGAIAGCVDELVRLGLAEEVQDFDG